jgi:uncharacterized membrane protein
MLVPANQGPIPWALLGAPRGGLPRRPRPSPLCPRPLVSVPLADEPPPRPGGLAKARIETLVDGVFAIAMTLLVLDLRPPGPEVTDLGGYLSGQGPTFLAYVLSFANLGVFWVGHHTQFEAVRRTDRVFHWINILFLMSIVLIPFSTATLSRHLGDPGAVALYGANFFGGGLSLLFLWIYATRGRRLVDPDLPAARVKLGAQRIVLGMGIIAAGMGAAFLDTRLSLALFALVPLYFMFPGAIDRFWAPQRPPPST